MEDAKKLKALIDGADKILVITHISPDPDALCSLLLTGTTLQANYPDKNIQMSSEELTGDLKFLTGYSGIKLQSLAEAISGQNHELIIMVDAMNLRRCTRGDAAVISHDLESAGVKLAIIDHHEPEGIETNALYINNGSPAATQDIYQILFKDLKLTKPDGYAHTAMLGIVSDTNRFMYDNPRHRDTFAIVSDLLDAGASIEELENKRNRFTKNEMMVLAELAANIRLENDFTYSFVSDEFKKAWFDAGKSPDELKLGAQIFINEYIRNIGTNKWGFMVYPDLQGGSNLYSVSFRAVGSVKDVAQIAKILGGGGHKASAGAKFAAASVKDAVDMVLAVVSA